MQKQAPAVTAALAASLGAKKALQAVSRAGVARPGPAPVPIRPPQPARLAEVDVLEAIRIDWE